MYKDAKAIGTVILAMLALAFFSAIAWHGIDAWTDTVVAHSMAHAK